MWTGDDVRSWLAGRNRWKQEQQIDEWVGGRQKQADAPPAAWARKPSALTLALIALCAGPTIARAAGSTSSLTVSKPWVRVVQGPAPAAPYFILSNASDKAATLVGLSSPDCQTLIMHQSRNLNGVESMAMVTQRTVPAHGQITFSPGGYHLMCMSPSKAVRPGGSIAVTLRFADGRRMAVRFPVRPFGG